MTGLSVTLNQSLEGTMAASNQSFDALEVDCPVCDGEGELQDSDGSTCTCCGGAGFVPTTIGERILALIRHNLKPMLEDLHEC